MALSRDLQKSPSELGVLWFDFDVLCWLGKARKNLRLLCNIGI